MGSNNNDPIQEKSVFRFGMRKFNGEDEDNRQYDDLHDCSTDLSDEGSRIEEIEHSRFAENRKRNIYSSTYNRTNNSSNNKNNRLVMNILIFIFFGIPIIQFIFGIVIAVITSISSEIVGELDNLRLEEDTSYYSEEEQNISNFEVGKENILVSGIRLSGNRMIIKTENSNSDVMTDIKIQIIFYDSENRPLAIEEVNIDTLFGNSIVLKEVYNMPLGFERYDFLITKPYDLERPIVNPKDIQAYLINEAEDIIDLQIVNNSNYKIDTAEIGILYYNGEDLVDYQSSNVYDIKAGKTAKETIYLHSDEVYTGYEYFINDVYIYE